jgi:hypothetical protein
VLAAQGERLRRNPSENLAGRIDHVPVALDGFLFSRKFSWRWFNNPLSGFPPLSRHIPVRRKAAHITKDGSKIQGKTGKLPGSPEIHIR